MNINRMGLVLLAGLAFGSSVVMTRLGISEMSPLWLVTLRLAAATLGSALMMSLLRRPLPRTLCLWLDIVVVGISNVGIPLVTFTLALQFISSGVLTIFLALIPLFTGLLAHFALAQERLSVAKMLGLLVSLAGLLLLLITRTTGLSNGAAGIDLRGYALALGGALSVAFAAVYTRRQLCNTDSLIVMAGQMAVGVLTVMPFAVGMSHIDLAAVTWRGWLAVTYSGMIGSCAAFLLFFYLVHRYGATTGTLPGYLVPVVAIGLGALLLGEVINGSLLLGAGVTLAGVFLANR